MKTIPKPLYLACLIGVGIVATLYAIALSSAPTRSLNITSMLGLEGESDVAALYEWLYTLSFFALMIVGFSFCFLRSLRKLTIALSGFCLVLTIVPLGYSLIFNYRPSIYERYVFEVLSCVGLGTVGWFCLQQRPNKMKLLTPARS